MNQQSKKHWENIYQTRTPAEVSWTQDVPKTSLDFIHSFGVDKTASIIDVGGGESTLVDYLLNEGYHNITVLDISANALERARKRLGADAARVKWIEADITQFKPDTTYEVWHDRATFHFLTTAAQVKKYLSTARKAVTGFMTIGTFSDAGPAKCSGLEIKQYTEDTLTEELREGFNKIRCITEDHITPFQTAQNFLFCSFKRSVPFRSAPLPAGRR
ncbi:MAG TPA: class I SAM-dependent methyltransferase [Sphingobacteriaceae bacterium]